MPASPSTLRVRILERDYTVHATTHTHRQLKDAARQLDTAMRAQQAQDPAAESTQLAVLAALELVHTAQAASFLHEREIARGLSALQRKLDHLDAAMSAPVSVPVPASPATSPAKIPRRNGSENVRGQRQPE